jgi:pimeloyl-ACP methyl ester carboxylesterase
MRWETWCRLLLALAAALANTGCGSFMAHRLAQAPNSYPTWFAPRAPVELVFGGNYLTNFPARYAEVGPPGARLCYRIVEPGDYQLTVSPESWVKRGHPRARFTFQATVPSSPTGFTATPRGTVVLLHCYGLNKSVMGPWALRLAQDGWRCVLVSLRGHGKSTGKRIYFGVQEARDLSQLLDGLAQDGPLKEPVAVLGYSYGAALALRWEAVEPRVRRAVAIAPYAELSHSILNVRRDYAGWMLQACVKAGLNRLPGLLGVEPGELDTSTVLARTSLTALFVAGGRDTIAPESDVSRLYALAASGSQLLVLPQATHESLPYWMDDLADPVLAWLAEATPAGTATGTGEGGAECRSRPEAGRGHEAGPRVRRPTD